MWFAWGSHIDMYEVDGASADEYMWTAFYNAIVSDIHLFLLLFLTLTTFNEVAYLTFKSIFHKYLNLF